MPTADVAIPKKERYTYEDYAALPEGAPYELIDGDLVMTASPNIQHQRIVGRLFRAMDAFVEERDLGEVFVSPVDVYLSEEDTPVPDVVFVAEERLHIVGEQKIEGGPDLIVEPVEESIEVYRNADGTFDLHERSEGEGRAASQVLDGLLVPLGDVFNP